MAQVVIEFVVDDSQLNQAKQDIDQLNGKIKNIGSPDKATSGLSSLKDQIKNVKAQTQLMTGAMILFGNKSAEVQQLIGKLHGAILLIKGASGITGLGKAFEGLSLSTLTARNAFNALKVAIASNPLGLLLTVITAAAVAMDVFGDKTDEATESIKKLHEAQELEMKFNEEEINSYLRKEQIVLDGYRAEIEQLKLKGASRKEIFEKEVELNKREAESIEGLKQALIKKDLFTNEQRDKIKLAEQKNKSDLKLIELQYAADTKKISEDSNKKAEELASKRRDGDIQADFLYRQLLIDQMQDGESKMRAQLQLEYDKDIEQLAQKYIDQLKDFDNFSKLYQARTDKFKKDSKFIVKRDEPLGPPNFNFDKKDDNEDIKTEEEKAALRKQIALETEQALVDIFKAGVEERIEELEREKEAALKSYDDRMEANREMRRRDVISEREFTQIEKKLLKDREKAELESNKKIREEKKKMAILERLEKLFLIAINTALHIVEKPALAAFYAILGAVQTAAVLAAPLPKYAKGTLSLQRGNNPSGIDTIPILANEGEAITPTPIAKQYRETLSAIHSQRIPAMAMNKFVRNYNNKNTSIVSGIDSSELAREIAWELRSHKEVKIKNLRELADIIKSNDHAVFQH
jgi:hypothetical protein